ncbi:MAG: dienelactone hydrolase family protein [Acidimicrobiales bacterium]
MGQLVTYPSNGSEGMGWLAEPAEPGPGLIVIQEWWGLVDHIKDVAERFAAAGFCALAPDLYRGASTAEPDEAGKLMMALDLERAGRDMGGAVEFVKQHPSCSTSTVGVVGYCMGGGLCFVLAAQRPDDVSAIAPYYGAIPWPEHEPDYAEIRAAVQGHYAENDDWASPALARDLEARLKGYGRQVEMHVYPGAQHGFFNDANPDVYDPAAAQQSWERVVPFLKGAIRP